MASTGPGGDRPAAPAQHPKEETRSNSLRAAPGWVHSLAPVPPIRERQCHRERRAQQHCSRGLTEALRVGPEITQGWRWLQGVAELIPRLLGAPLCPVWLSSGMLAEDPHSLILKPIFWSPLVKGEVVRHLPPSYRKLRARGGRKEQTHSTNFGTAPGHGA